MIRDQIIVQCLSTRLRRRLLRKLDLTLKKAMAIGRSFKASERRASQIESDSLKTTDLEVNAIRLAQEIFKGTKSEWMNCFTKLPQL